MAKKIILDVDPGIDDAVALFLALANPAFEVVAVTATGGIVSPDQSTTNVQAIVEQLDPPRWPRLGTASPEQMLRTDGPSLFGTDGLCGATFPLARRHHQHSSLKVLCDEVRSSPGEITIISTGPLSNIAAALRQHPDLAELVHHLIIVGGTLRGPGNVTAAAEFNMYCDAPAAHGVFCSQITKTLIPFDLTSRMTINLDVLEKLPNDTSPSGGLLRSLLPGAFRAYRQQLGREGIHLHDAVAIVYALRPELFTIEHLHGDIETEGTISYGATVIDRRRPSRSQPNMDVVVDMDAKAVAEHVVRGLTEAA